MIRHKTVSVNRFFLCDLCAPLRVSALDMSETQV